MEPAALEPGREAIVALEKWRNRTEPSFPGRGLPQATVVGFQMENGNCILEITAPREPLGARFRSDLKNLNALRIFRSDAETLYKALAMEFGGQPQNTQPEKNGLLSPELGSHQSEQGYQPEFIRMSKACIQGSPARKTKLARPWTQPIPQLAEVPEVPSATKIMADIYAMNEKLAAALASEPQCLQEPESLELSQEQTQPQDSSPVQQPACVKAPNATPPAAKSTFNFSPRKQNTDIPQNTEAAPKPAKEGVDCSSLDESQALMMKANNTRKMLMNHLIDQYFANNAPI
ncbi:MAG TPA: hypothetical protein V6C52_06310 [Coleofasciculaceae cyanobacterium]|jgi:hypothetical protein